MFYKIATINLNAGQKSNVISEVFVSQPDSNKERLAGKLFLLIEMASKKAADLKIINFLINNLNNNYYYNDKILLRERITTLKIEHIFETTLTKTNKDFIKFLEEEKISFNPTTLNLTAGVIFEDEIHFSQIGKNKALLIYKHIEPKNNLPYKKIRPTVMTEEQSEYRIINVLKEEKESPVIIQEAKADDVKIFSSVTNGKIPTGGYFLFTNETLPEYLSNKQLINIITKLSPVGAAEQIKGLLASVNSYVSFAGIIIKNQIGQIDSSPIPERETTNAQNSILNLQATEQNTEKFLSLSGIIDIKKILAIPLGLLTNIWQKQVSAGGQNKLFLKDKIFFREKISWLSVKNITSLLTDLFTYIIGALTLLAKLVINKNNYLNLAKNAKKTWLNFKQWLIDFKIWHTNLKIMHKVLIYIFVLILIGFSTNIYLTKKQNTVIIQKANLTDIISKIEQKQNQIDANLLYSNEDGAKKLLEEVDALYKQFPQDTDEEKTAYNKYFTKFQEQMEKIQYVVKINNAKEIANFTNLNTGAQAENIVLANNKIYSGDNSTKTIYIVDLKDSLVTATTDLSINIQNLKNPTTNKENQIFYLNNNSFIKLDTSTNTLSNINVEMPASPEEISGASNFNNRIYLLSPQKNQIFRFTQKSNTIDSLYSWVTDKTDLSSAVDISIDGNIFILQKNGEILKFLSGAKQDFSLEKISPSFEEASKLYVSPNLDFIYILEKKNNRLAIFNKKGDFILQYKSDKLSDIKDFAVNEVAKKIYLLNNNFIFEIDAVHIK